MALWLYVVSILLIMALPIAAASLLRRRRRGTPWYLFLVGAATFAVSQAVHIPLNNWLSDIGWLSTSAPLWQTALIAGLTAGLCEELARAGAFALLKNRRDTADGLMLGIGHGGIECIGLVAVMLGSSLGQMWSLWNADLTTLSLSAAQLAAVSGQLSLLKAQPLIALLPALERLMTLGIHIGLSLLVLQAFRQRSAFKGAAFVLLAVLAHAAVDAGAVYAAAKLSLGWLAVAEALLAVVAWAIVAHFWPRPARDDVVPAPLVSQRRLFFWQLRKELTEMWRTRRLLVIVVVLVLFGILSPLMAYFLPQILSGVEGYEQIASLFADPSPADAMSEYVQNVTQTGFMVIILVGMTAVAGEKMRGTAPMTLSKPLSRSTFVLAKWVAQMGVYALGFAGSMLCAWFYIWQLYGTAQFGSVLAATGLMYVWAMVYCTLTLLGSTLGKNIGSAAGFALGLCILVMTLGSIPALSPYAPGALTSWALAIPVDAPMPTGVAAGGALVVAFALMELALVGSVAVIERQEI